MPSRSSVCGKLGESGHLAATKTDTDYMHVLLPRSLARAPKFNDAPLLETPQTHAYYLWLLIKAQPAVVLISVPELDRLPFAVLINTLFR